MAELKTRKNRASVTGYLAQAGSERQEDSTAILDMMRDATGEQPAMWGSSIVGVGNYHYKYESRREGDSFLTGFASRNQNMALYIMSGLSRWQEILDGLRKYKIGKPCLYIKRFSDIDSGVLSEMIHGSAHYMRAKYGPAAG